MNRIITILSFILITAGNLFCQSNKASIEQNGNFNSTEILQSGSENSLLLKQVGNFNNNITEQNGNGNYFLGADIVNCKSIFDFDLSKFTVDIQKNEYNKNSNSSLVSQNGSYNGAALMNLGACNSTTISQNGNMNMISSINSGDDNNLKLVQNGKMNLIDQMIYSSGANYELTQKGNNNRLYQLDNTNDGIDLKITQNGNWIQTIIINGSYK